MGNFIYNHRFKDAVSDIEPKIDLVGDSEIVLAKQDEKIVFKNASGNIVTVPSEDQIEGMISGNVANFFDGAGYDEDAKVINFYHGRDVMATIDATPFIIDGMVDDVKVEDGKLVIVFNTASGKSNIEIPLTEIFDPSNYYTKAEVDAALSAKADTEYVNSEIERVEGEIPSLDTVYTKDEVDALLAAKDAEIEELQAEYNRLRDIVLDLYYTTTYSVPTDCSLETMLKSNNGEAKLTENITTGTIAPGTSAKNIVNLKLNGKNITFTGSTTNNPAIMVRNKQQLTIINKGTIDAGGRIAIEANGADCVVTLGGQTMLGARPTYVTDRSGGELIYCYEGTINITNGVFKNLGEDKTYLLNCYDANYRNGTAKIVVTGGSFYDFNPADNSAEGEHTSFVLEGYHVEVSTDGDSTVYTVKKD